MEIKQYGNITWMAGTRVNSIASRTGFGCSFEIFEVIRADGTTAFAAEVGCVDDTCWQFAVCQLNSENLYTFMVHGVHATPSIARQVSQEYIH